MLHLKYSALQAGFTVKYGVQAGGKTENRARNISSHPFGLTVNDLLGDNRHDLHTMQNRLPARMALSSFVSLVWADLSGGALGHEAHRLCCLR